MSFYTALTGLNGSSADISATSNNIANVGTTGFKRSRVEFGDIFATSPLQNASSSIGSGTILKGIKQQFTQGNIASSLNALDLAISGQGFFALKPSLTSAQTVYTRNGSLNVNNDRYVVDSAGQYLLTYPVNTDGSVTAKDLQSAVPLQLPVTSGDPQATSNIKLGVNVNAASDVVPARPQFQDGYTFDPNDPETFTNSTSITIFDDLGNPTIATVYFIKTQAASAQDPTNKYDTRLVINDTIINPDLVSAVDDAGNQIFVDRFGQQTTTIPDDNYFIEGKGSPLYKLDDLQTLVPSQPASISGEPTSFDFGEEGDKLVEIVTDPLQFKATREAGNSGSDVYWGKDFLLVNVDDSDQPVSIDINPGFYNADQLAAEVERAINAAYGDDRKFQVEQNVDDTITLDFQRVGADGAVTPLTNKISVELLGTDSFVTEAMGEDFAITGTSPDFTKEQFLAHAQLRINETLNEYGRAYDDDPLGIGGLKFVKSRSEKITEPYEYNQIVELERVDDAADKNYMVHSYYNKRPSLSVHSVLDEVSGNGTSLISYAATENRLRIYLDASADLDNYEQGRSIMLAGDDNFRADLNGRSFVISSNGLEDDVKYIDVSTSGLAVAEENFSIAAGSAKLFALTSPAGSEPTVEAFFEGSSPVYDGAREGYSSQHIVIRERQGSNADTAKGAFVASDWKLTNGTEGTDLSANLALLGLNNLKHPMIITEPDATYAGDMHAVTFDDGNGNILHVKPAAIAANGDSALQTIYDATQVDGFDSMGYDFQLRTENGVTKLIVNRDDMADFSITNHGEEATFTGFTLPTTTAATDTFSLNIGPAEKASFDNLVLPTAGTAGTDTFSLKIGGNTIVTTDTATTKVSFSDLVLADTATEAADTYSLVIDGQTVATTATAATEKVVFSDLVLANTDTQATDTYALSIGGTTVATTAASAYANKADVATALQAALTNASISDYTVGTNGDGDIVLEYASAGNQTPTAYAITYMAGGDGNGTGTGNTDGTGTITEGTSLDSKSNLASALQAALDAEDPAITDYTISTNADGEITLKYLDAGSQTPTSYAINYNAGGDGSGSGTGNTDATGVITPGADYGDPADVATALQAALDADGIGAHTVSYNTTSGKIELTYTTLGNKTPTSYAIAYNGDGTGGNDGTGTITNGTSYTTAAGAYTTKTQVATALQAALTAASQADFTISSVNGELMVKHTTLGNDGIPSYSLSYSGTNAMDDVNGTIVDGNNSSVMVSVDGGTTTAALSTAEVDAAGAETGNLLVGSATTTNLTKSSVDWVDEKNPPVKVGYDAVNQRLSFEVDRTILGSGTDSNFNSFSVYGSATQTGTNNLGLTNADNAQRVPIRGGEVLYGDPFVATGEEIQPNDKRYGIKVSYNSELQNFAISSGTTGEAIAKDGAIGVDEQQKASNIQVGRYAISETTGARVAQPYNVDATIIGNGDNSLFGVGSTKNDFLFTAGTGLKATPAMAVGASANEPLTNVFKLSTQNGDNIFNVSVNGVSGIIEVPATSYVGTTLAEALQTRINQIVDPATGDTIGGVSVTYSSDTNSFTFATGTTGSDSTIKVKGAARLGLDDVPLGVGSVPEIYNLVQATDADGVALYVDENGEVVTNPPANLVEGYYPLYIDEGELTFDKTGKLVSPKNLVHYEKQEEGFSISLDVDFSTSSQLAQPFSVLTVEQDGFTSGRLDGIEIDSSGTIRANYTNGQNNPLGKIVVANFNNQNGLKQIGNATYTETAVSGTPQVGEAGAEGFGNILSGSLERSNVDITEELVNLITAQRNFQASAKAIETTTGLTQTIINIRM